MSKEFEDLVEKASEVLCFSRSALRDDAGEPLLVEKLIQ